MAATKKTDDLTPVPLSDYKGPLQDFCRDYNAVPLAERPSRMDGDMALLNGLHKSLRVARLWDDASTVRDLSEAAVRDSVDAAEVWMGGRWALAGDDSEDLFDRLDRHFMPLQEAYAERRRAARRQLDAGLRRARERDQETARRIGETRERQLEQELAALRGTAA